MKFISEICVNANPTPKFFFNVRGIPLIIYNICENAFFGRNKNSKWHSVNVPPEGALTSFYFGTLVILSYSLKYYINAFIAI